MVKKDYGFNEIYEVFFVIEVLVVRNFVIFGLVVNKYEIEFLKIVFKIY